MTYPKKPIDGVRIIGENSVEELFTWVVAAYAAHDDMKSQTGGIMSFGYGTVHCRSSKQKLNTKSSTEVELVGSSEYVSFNVLIIMFMEAQGYAEKKNVLFQNN